VPSLRTVSTPIDWLSDSVTRTGLTPKEAALATLDPITKRMMPEAALIIARASIRKAPLQ
jgi:hypothetical protein